MFKFYESAVNFKAIPRSICRSFILTYSANMMNNNVSGANLNTLGVRSAAIREHNPNTIASRKRALEHYNSKLSNTNIQREYKRWLEVVAAALHGIS